MIHEYLLIACGKKKIEESNRQILFIIRTYAFELPLQVSHVLALRDPEVIIRKISLVDTVGWIGGADG